MNQIPSLTAQQLRQAADLKDQIDALQNQLSQMLGGEVPTPSKVAPEAPEAPKKRKMSAAGRAAITAGVRARWAKIRGTAPSATPGQKPKRKISAAGRAAMAAAARAKWAKLIGTAPTQKPKKKMSAAGRARLAASARARWAKAKKAGKTRL